VSVLGAIAAGKDEAAKKSRIPITVSDRIQAIRLLLLYGYGVPKQPEETGPVKIEVTYADNRQVNITGASQESVQDHQGSPKVPGRVLRKALGKDDTGDEPPDPSGLDG
jgi:hypothetical protein